MNEQFPHLHGHFCYSLLDGITKPDEAIEKAAKLGMCAVAITDHGVMWGCAELFYAAKKIQEMGDEEFAEKGYKSRPKAIMGMEAYYASGMRFPTKDTTSPSRKNYHMVLLARNYQGWQNLCRMHYISSYDGFFRKPRIDMELLREYGEGVTVLAACIAGYPQQQLLMWKATGEQQYYDMAVEHIKVMKEVTGGNYYLEVQDTGVKKLEKVGITIELPQRWLAEMFEKLSVELDVPIVLTNDFHLLDQHDIDAHTAALRIVKRSYSDDGDQYAQNWMKSQEEMAQLYPDHPEWMDNAVTIAAQCDVDITYDGYLLPSFDVPEEFESQADYLRSLVDVGFKQKYPETHPRREEAVGRLAEELRVIEAMGFPGYFLIVHDIYAEATRRNIPRGLGRGSAAGSIVSYCLGITQLCPLEFDLLFERFLNESRVSLPDIDMDFCGERRDELIEYVKEKYGSTNVAHILTFNTMATRLAIKDVGRALEIPLDITDSLTKQIPVKFGKPMELEEAFELDILKPKLEDPQIRELFKQAKKLEGLPRSRGTHAAGVIISPRPIWELIPTFHDRDKGVMITGFNDKTCEKLGLVKMDFLGLATLTIYANAKAEIKARLGVEIIDEDIPYDDSRTWNLLSTGATCGVFQLGESGFANYTRFVAPDKLEDLVAMAALYRPGPMDHDMHKDYVYRKDGAQQVVYWPQSEDIMASTFGLMVFQEQVMQATQVWCNWNLQEADNLRKGIGKKDEKAVQKLESGWKASAKETGILTEAQIEEVWDSIYAFRNYGFNRSHAAAYGVFAYRTAYLKANYPEIYLMAMLNNELSDAEDISTFAHEAKTALGINILPPDINRSGIMFELEDDAIRYGLAAIKGISITSAKAVVSARRKGKITSIQDLCHKGSRVINKKVLEALVKAGAFYPIYEDKHEALATIETALKHGKEYQKAQAIGGFMDLVADADEDRQEFEAANELQTVELEAEALGFYLTRTPVDLHREMLTPLYRRGKLRRLSELKAIYLEDKNTYVYLVGMLVNLVQKTSKSKKTYYNFELQDSIRITGVAWDNLSSKINGLENGAVVAVYCKIEESWRTEGKYEIKVYDIERLTNADALKEFMKIKRRGRF